MIRGIKRIVDTTVGFADGFEWKRSSSSASDTSKTQKGNNNDDKKKCDCKKCKKIGHEKCDCKCGNKTI